MSRWWIPAKRANSSSYVKRRLSTVPQEIAMVLGRCLRYLYLDKRSIDRKTIRHAEASLEPPERLLIRYLQTRSSGSEKKRYGHAAVAEAKAAKFRCRDCGCSDVRVLTLDHVHGKGSKVFRLLCANCHQLKSRMQDWVGSTKASKRPTRHLSRPREDSRTHNARGVGGQPGSGR